VKILFKLFTHVETGRIRGYLCATTITTIFYIARKEIGTLATAQAVTRLLELFEVAPVNRLVLKTAAEGSFSDFEDGVLYESARRVGTEVIVTCNVSDFKEADMPIYSPDDLNALVNLRDE
jgi:predicted nucleic acid-binding protein